VRNKPSAGFYTLTSNCGTEGNAQQVLRDEAHLACKPPQETTCLSVKQGRIGAELTSS